MVTKWLAWLLYMSNCQFPSQIASIPLSFFDHVMFGHKKPLYSKREDLGSSSGNTTCTVAVTIVRFYFCWFWEIVTRTIHFFLRYSFGGWIHSTPGSLDRNSTCVDESSHCSPCSFKLTLRVVQNVCDLWFRSSRHSSGRKKKNV